MTFADLLYSIGIHAGEVMLKSTYGRLPLVYGLGNLPKEGPAVFVSNHLDEYRGPLAVTSVLPMRVYPWVAWNLMEPKSAIDMGRDGFFGRRYGDSIVSRMGSFVFGGLAWAFNVIDAIPVYRDPVNFKGTPRLRETYAESVTKLQEGKFLLVFPELMLGEADGTGMWPFQEGIAKIAELYFRKQGSDSKLSYYLNAVSHETGDVMISSPFVVTKDMFSDRTVARKEITITLEDRVRKMAEALLSKKSEEELEEFSREF